MTKLTQPEHPDNSVSDFINCIKKDSDMQGLSFPLQKELWNRIERKNKYYDRRFARLLVWSASVASVICLLVVASWFMLSSPEPDEVDYAGVMKSFEHANQTSGNVQLILSSNQKISIEGKETQLQYEEEGWVSINKNEKMEVKENASGGQPVFNQLIVPAGKRSMLILNDGTRIWINSGSKLVYPVYFGQHKREIFIDGEIYLDVYSDPKRPFVVRTHALDVKVLGTEFNVSAYSGQPEMKVVLVAGEVEIQQSGNSKEILRPSQMFSYNEKTQEHDVSIIDVAGYIAWKDGYYPFYHQDLGTVLEKLSKYYDVTFKWTKNVRELSCSGKLDLNEDIQKVINALEKTAPIEIQKTSEREYSVIVKP